jgi:disulfide bond formation protein DsbB
VSTQLVSSYNAFLAVLALASLAGAIALTVPAVRARVRASVRPHELLAAGTTVAAVATAGSLTYSEVIGYQPCFLCWVQRGFMYPLVLVGLAAAIVTRRNPAARSWLPVMIVALGGFGVSAWHYFEQLFPDLSAGVCVAGVSCTARYVNVMGFVTIPFMAGCGFLAIAALAWTARRRTASNSEKTRTVVDSTAG